MTHPLNFLNPDDQTENTCLNCEVPTEDKYCSEGCKHEYNQ